MRILMISPYPVFPLVTGGKIRTVQIARSLCDLGAAVTILTPFHPTQRRVLFQNEKFDLQQVAYPFVIPFLFTDKPFPYSYLTSFHPGLALLARRFFSGFDIYQFEHAQFAQLADAIAAPGIVTYDAHNVEYDYTCSECQSPLTRSIAGKRIQALEQKLVDKAAHTFVVSASDAERMAALYGVPSAKLSVAVNGMKPLSASAPGDGQKMWARFPALQQFPRRAVFSGSDVAHNRVAVGFVLEHLASALPEYAFIIHGACGNSFAQVARSNVFFDPVEANFSDYAAAGAVGLNPIGQGSGTNLKLLNYLSHGMIALSTPFGVRGYEGLRAHVTVGELHDFAKIMRAGEFAPPPDPRALEASYSWRAVAGDMLRVYDRLKAG